MTSMELRERLLDEIDILIAGIAVANGMWGASRNGAHFARPPGVAVEDRSSLQ
jgi:predicted nucleic acid-binding protein